MAEPEQHHHHHGHAHLDEAAWTAMIAHTELAGQLLVGFVTETAAWASDLRGPSAPPMRRILDIGSGPGVGTCELARLFPEADVCAIDSSPATLERAMQRASEHGVAERVTTHLAELPEGLDGIARADLIWASMSLHHVGDEVGSLRILRELLEPDGLIAIAELAEPMRILAEDAELGRPGLMRRLDRAGQQWFGHMRDGLADSISSRDLPSMVAEAGFAVIGSRTAHKRFDAPLSDDARRVALGFVGRARHQFGEYLDADDRDALAVLADADDPRGVMHRGDVFVAASQQIVIGRPVDPK